MIKTILITAAALFCAAWARADGLSELEYFLRHVHSAQASFTQVVTSPTRPGQNTPRQKTSYGQFEFLRPNQFRFQYTQPFEQTIVADGNTLWLYDPDLNQVTARKQQDALGSTPASLIAAGADMQALSQSFYLTAQPAQNGMDWLVAQPRQPDEQVQNIRIGFRRGQLAILEILDGTGQRSVLTFTQWKNNTPLTGAQFKFQAPKGADVIWP